MIKADSCQLCVPRRCGNAFVFKTKMIQRNGKWVHAQSDGMQSSPYFLARETDFYTSGYGLYEDALAKLQTLKVSAADSPPPAPPSGDACSSSASVAAEIAELELRQASMELELKAVTTRRIQAQAKTAELQGLVENVNTLTNQLVLSKIEVDDDLVFAKKEHARVCGALQRLMHINVYNDSFHIWFSGPFATINGLRLGRLPFLDPVVEWSEINAALGHAALAVFSLATKLGEFEFGFQKFTVLPLGSASRVKRTDDADGSKAMDLFTDGNFGYFTGKGAFNKALTAFLCCVDELGAFVSARDPTVPVPHAISPDCSSINDLPIALGTDFELWTKALKCLLTNIKWIIAWVAKHTR